MIVPPKLIGEGKDQAVLSEVLRLHSSAQGTTCRTRQRKEQHADFLLASVIFKSRAHSFIKNCTVHAMSIGTAIYAAELLGGHHLIEGNVFHFAADPSRSSRGAIDFGVNSDAITADTVGTLTIDVKRNTFLASIFSEKTMLLYARNAGTSNKINIDFTDNNIVVNRYHSWVMLRHAKGVAASEFVNIARNQASFEAETRLYLDGDYNKLAHLRGAAVD